MTGYNSVSIIDYKDSNVSLPLKGKRFTNPQSVAKYTNKVISYSIVHHGIILFCNHLSEGALAGRWGTHHAHFAWYAGVGRKKVGSGIACELHQSLWG